MKRNSDGTFADSGKGGRYQVAVRLKEPYASFVANQENGATGFVRALVIKAYEESRT
jgi:hypothetical protein